MVSAVAVLKAKLVMLLSMETGDSATATASPTGPMTVAPRARVAVSSTMFCSLTLNESNLNPVECLVRLM